MGFAFEDRDREREGERGTEDQENTTILYTIYLLAIATIYLGTFIRLVGVFPAELSMDIHPPPALEDDGWIQIDLSR